MQGDDESSGDFLISKVRYQLRILLSLYIHVKPQRILHSQPLFAL